MGVAVITGAERGIGSAVARLFAERGDEVVIGALDLAAGRDKADELRAVGRVEVLPLDVTDDASIEAFFDRVEERHPAIDALVNNAGLGGFASAFEVTREQFRAMYEVNVFGAAMMTRRALPLLAESLAGGRIVNVSSGGGSLGIVSDLLERGVDSEPIIAYASSKAALNMITLQTALALRGAPGYERVKINCAAPAMTATLISGYRGQAPEDAARLIIRLATLGPDGPSGEFHAWEGRKQW